MRFRHTECTQVLEKHDGFFEPIPKLICAQQLRSKCGAVGDVSVDCKQCGKCTHVYWAECTRR